MAIQYRRIAAKTLIGAAIVAGCWIGVSAPADAEPTPSQTSDPFGGLHCGACHKTPGHGSPEAALHEGMRQALAN